MYIDHPGTIALKEFAVALILTVLAGCGGAGNKGGTGSTDAALTAPADVAASAGNATVTLSWGASGGATGYNVKRSTASGGPYSQLAASTSTGYTDSSTSNGIAYYYVVAAFDAASESANSSQVSATPEAPAVAPSAPSAPTALTASAGNAQVSLTWSPSSGASSYDVQRSTTSGGPYTQIASSGSPSYTDSTVSNGTAYFYVVTAVNATGESPDSAQASATPDPAISTPAIPMGLAATSGNAQASLTWSASSAASSYHVKRATTSGGSYSQVGAPTAAAYTDTKLTNGTKYYYVVSALDSAGESANSAQVSAAPVAPVAPVVIPAAPTNLMATSGNAQASLTWSASSAASSYHVKRATTSGGPYSQVGNPTATTYTDTKLTNGTKYYYVVSALDSAGESANSAQASASPTAPPAADVTVTVDPSSTHPISAYIYGVNSATIANVYPTGTASGLPNNLAFDRYGGNRLTAYNWETNASNAGSDYLYENDADLSSSSVSGAATTAIVSEDQTEGMASLITLQMQGLVAGDENGPVSIASPPDLTRFKSVVFQKSSVSSQPFTVTPITTDANVYMDEFLWAVDQKFSGQGIFGNQPTTQHVFAQLDNEPELWNSTHLEVQGAQPVTSDVYIAKTINLATSLKKQFPNLLIFGPVHYGFFGIYAWNGELSPTPSGNNWFPDKYLPAMKAASTSFGKPLVDIYDFHWYSEATDGSGNRVTTLNAATLSNAQIQAIVQSPRSLWDPTYQENSWIPSALGGPIYILPRLQAKIDAENPGMKLSITEYNNGGAQHIAGTIAEADNLGVFGVQGLFAANLWPLVNSEPYLLAGFRAFRDFDGANHNFGDTSVQSTSSNVADVVVYVSTDSTRPGRVVMVAINRSTSAQTTAVSGQALSGTAHLFQMTAVSAGAQNVVKPVSIGTQAVSGNSLTLSLPSLSVTTIDIY